nr:efflux RND transporter periplasmic adaptor subunit [Sphingomonas sp. YR710]
MSDAPSPRHLARYGIGAGILALIVVVTGIATRVSADHSLKAAAAENAVPAVTLAKLQQSDGSQNLVLPGTLQAFNSAALYARTNGYVRRWLADIGDHVSAGQTLAIIDAPEIDLQLAQARADYQTAAANQALARTTAVRWDALLAKDAVSKQEADEKRGDLAAKSALAQGQAANVRRLGTLQGFTRIEAPFAGTVTSRSAQIGALIVAGNAASQPLFTVSDVHRIRIYVRVPQNYSAQVHAGMHAKLQVPEYPGRDFDAVLTRAAGAVDVASGTMLIELQADNKDRLLKPGGYAQVSFPLKAAGIVELPSSALVTQDKGMAVAIVGAGNHIHLQPITIARDNGATVEIATGLTGQERIVDSPPDAIAEGDEVRVETAPAAAPAKG